MEPAPIHEPVHIKHPELIESEAHRLVPASEHVSDHVSSSTSNPSHEKQDPLPKWIKKIEELQQKSQKWTVKQDEIKKKAEKAIIQAEIYQKLYEEAKKRLEDSQKRAENLSKKNEDISKKISFFNAKTEQIALKIENIREKQEEKHSKKHELLARKEELKKRKEELLHKKEENKKRKEEKLKTQKGKKKTIDSHNEEKKTEYPDNTRDSFLHYGCLVTLSFKQNHFAHSDGFIDDSLYSTHSDHIQDFSQAVFRILPQCAHTTQDKLIKASIKPEHKPDSNFSTFSDIFSSSETALRDELKENLENYEKNKGVCLKFGSIVYLQHVQSHRFLTVIPNEVSSADKDSLKVCLANFPNDQSYIRLESSYNFQKEGEGLIRKVDMVILEVLLTTKTVSISASENKTLVHSDLTETREVIGCLDRRSKWQINLYFPVNLEDSKLISCGEYIKMSHSEGKAILVGSQKGSHVYFHTNLDNNNGIWEVESEDFTTGGFVFSEKTYRIKHLSSSLYLTLEVSKSGDFFGRLAEKNDENSLWRFEQVHSKKVNSKIYSEQFYSLVNDRLNVKVQALENIEVSNVIMLGFKDDSSESSYLKIFRVDSNTLWEAQFTKGCIPLLSSLNHFISIFRKNKNQFDFAKVKKFKRKMDITEKCLKDVNDFIENKMQNRISVGKHYGIIDKARQMSIRELGILDILTEVLQNTFVDEFSLDKLQALTSSGDSSSNREVGNNEQGDSFKDFQISLFLMLKNMTNCIYLVISAACVDNLENQTYVFKFFKTFQKHAGYHLGATRCLTVLLSNNENLLYRLHRSFSLNQSEKNTTVIDFYISLLKKFHKERKPQLVEFLRVVCECNEIGIAASQEKVHENMFYIPDSYDKIIIPTSIDPDKKTLKVLLQHETGVGEAYYDFNSLFADGQLKDHKSELNYFSKTIGVFSSLCKGRNYICKTSISNWFPLELLITSIWNKELTLEIRANFLELLISMHIDFMPRYFIQKPDLIRTLEMQGDSIYISNFRARHKFNDNESGFEMLRKLKTDICDRRYSISSNASKRNTSRSGEFILIANDEMVMFELKCALIEQVNNGEERKFDEFYLQLLKLSRLFIQFEVITMEVSSLGERKCFLYKSENFKNDLIDIYRLLRGIQTMFFGNQIEKISGKTLVMKNQTLITEKSQATVRKSNQKLQFDISEEPFANYLEGIQNYLQYKAHMNVKSEDGNSVEIRCKLEYCKIINLLINMRQETVLTNLIESKNQLSTDDEIVSWMNANIKIPKKNDKNDRQRQASNKNGPIFDPFSNLYEDSGRDWIEDLLRMFNSTINYKLKSEIIGIILRIFSQTRDFIKNIKKLKIMESPNDSDLVLWCKVSILNFKILSEQSEIICKYWIQNSSISARNLEKLGNLMELLDNFIMVMREDCELKEGELISYKNKIQPARQIMLKNLKFHVYVTNIIKDCMYILEDIFDYQKTLKEKKAKSLLVDLFKKCYKCLQKFTYANPANQRTLFPYLNVFTSYLRIQLGQIDLLCDMFRDNADLCTLLTENTLQLFINLILSEGRQGDFLNFFKVVTKVKGVGIQHIQRIILMLLTNSEQENHLCYKGKDGKFEFSQNLNYNSTNPSYIDQPNIYHAKLISVLTKCGTSETTFYFNAKCQKIIPLSNLIETLSKPLDSSVEVKLLDFLIQIYLKSNSKSEESEIYSLNLSRILVLKTNQLNQALKKTISLKCLKKWVEILFLYKNNKVLKKGDYHSQNTLTADTISYLTALINYLNREKILKISHEFHHHLNELCTHFNIQKPENIEVEEVSEEPLVSSSQESTEWEKFLERLLKIDMKKKIKEERREFLKAIQLWTGAEGEGEGENKQLIESFIEFLSKAKVLKPPIPVLYQVIKFLSEYISESDKKKNNQDGSEIDTKKANQDHFRTCRIIQIVLDLMCDKEVDRRIFSVLVKFCVALLDGGNNDMQHDFYSYFSIFASSEHFFSALHSIIVDHISLFTLHKEIRTLNNKLKKSNKLVNEIIKLLQLFCENHFELLQNYIRVQDKSHNNHDLVVTVISLLQELMRMKRYDDFLIMSHCFEMLTECIQGPCRNNQKAIIESKFLDIASDLLSIDEKSEKLYPYATIKDSSKENEPIKSPVQPIEFPKSLKSPAKQPESIKLLELSMISRLKYKCMITLIALLEGQTDNYILVRMARTFNLQIFRQNLITTYTSHSENLKYKKELFYDFTKKKNSEPGNGKLLIEVGFFIYFLLKYFFNIKDKEVDKLLENDIPEFVELSEKLKEEYSKPQTTTKVKLMDFDLESEGKDVCLMKALKFFEDNTANVEVVFQEVLCVAYFWLPPVCHHLTYETIQDFHNRVDRSSDKKKVEYLVSQAGEIIEDMRYEEKLSNAYGYKLIGQHVRKVKFVAFLLSIVLNMLILLSYNSFQGDRFNKPSLGMYESNDSEELNNVETENLILGLGVIQAILSGLIFFFFIIKTAPMLVLRLWKQQEQKDSESQAVDSSSKFHKIIQTILYTLLNFDVVYHFFYFSFSILAITLHPFYYSAHLLDIMYRFPSLQGVVKSVVDPWRQLLLTLVFIIVIVYLFSVWAYFRLQDDFISFDYPEYKELCSSLFFCFINVFDKGIKNYGGVGLWLDYMSAPVPGTVDKERFIFDNIFVVIIWFIMLNIVQGIIYVTFANIREQDKKNEDDLNNKCFICGKEREIVERITEQTFAYHRLMEHNEWNYIHFIAYLTFKEPTEHSGIESHVNALIKSKKIDWIPQQQCLSFSEKEKKEENLVQLQINYAQEMLSKYQRVLKRIRKSLEGQNK